MLPSLRHNLLALTHPPICQDENPLLLAKRVHVLSGMERLTDLCTSVVCREFLDEPKSIFFLGLVVGQACLLDRATHPGVPATEATDAEHTICGQTAHENL